MEDSRKPLAGTVKLKNMEFCLNPEKPVDRGGSCLVYHASQTDTVGQSRNVILKEFYPHGPDSGSWRQEDGSLVFPGEDWIALRRSRFQAAYETSKRFFNDASLNLYTVQPQCCPDANGTVYMVVDYSSGETLADRMQHLSLHDFLSLMMSLCTVMEQFHKNGYIHMDLKPENLLCLGKEEKAFVRLLDVDSFVHKSSFENRDPDLVLSDSPGYGAPEVRELGKHLDEPLSYRYLWNGFAEIGERADIFSFGAIVYAYIFGKAPDGPWEKNNAYENRLKSCLQSHYKDVPEKAVIQIRQLLKKALAEEPDFRYASGAELETELRALLPLVSPREIRVRENFCKNPCRIIGRTGKLRELEDMLQQQKGPGRVVCIVGIGGVGKSALARLYGEVHAESYSVRVEVSASSAAEAVRKIRFFNWEPEQTDSPEDQTQACVSRLVQLNRNSRMLLIVHDYDDSEDPIGRIWEELGCDVILTSRSHDWSAEGIPMVTLKCADLADQTEDGSAEKIFYQYYFMEIPSQTEKDRLTAELQKDSEALKLLLERLSYHPLAIRFLARYMTAVPGKELLPSQALEELDCGIFDTDSPVEFRHGKDEGFVSDNISGHLSWLFRRSLENSRVSPEDLEALRYMTLIPPAQGISPDRFESWTGGKAIRLGRLRQQGWLEYLPEKQDPLETKPHTGVYVMPGIFQQMLRKKTDMEIRIPDIRRYIDNLGKFFMESGTFADRQAAVSSLELLLTVPEEPSEAYVSMLLLLYQVNSVLGETGKMHKLSESILDLYHRIPQEEQNNQQMAEYIPMVRSFSRIVQRDWEQIEDLLDDDGRKQFPLVMLIVRNRIRFDHGELNGAVAMAKKLLEEDFSAWAASDRFAFWNHMTYLYIHTGSWENGEIACNNMSNLFWTDIYPLKDARYNPAFFDAVSVYGRWKIRGGCSEETLTLLRQLTEAARKLMGEKHYYAARLGSTLANAHVLRGEPELAAACRATALGILEDPMEKAECMMHLAMDCRDGNPEESRRYREEAMKLYQDAAGEEETPGDLTDLSILYYSCAAEEIQTGMIVYGFEILDNWLWLLYRYNGFHIRTATHFKAVAKLYQKFGFSGKARFWNRCCLQILNNLPYKQDRQEKMAGMEETVGEFYDRILEAAETHRLRHTDW